MSPDGTTDAATLSDLVTACSRVTEYVRGARRSDLDHNRQLLSACCYQIAVIGEAVKRLSSTTRGKYPEIPWKDIAGMRDRLNTRLRLSRCRCAMENFNSGPAHVVETGQEDSG